MSSAINQEIAAIFYRMVSYMEMDGVAFKPQAYEKAATALEALSKSAEEIYEQEGLKGLERIAGVGKGLAGKIEEYINTGTIREYEEYRKTMPVELKELTSIEGVGAKMVKELYEKLKIKTVDDLEKAAKEGKLQNLPRFGKKKEQNILQGIEFLKKGQGRYLLGDIFENAQDLVQTLKESELVEEAIVAGSFRRRKETCGDIDILAISDKPKEVSEFFLSHVKHTKVWGAGTTKTAVRTITGLDIDVRVLPKESYGAGLLYFTGSKEHNVKLRALAQKQNYKVSEYGVFKEGSGGKMVAGKTEEEIYKLLGMQYIEPELREDQGEIEAALQHTLPKLISYDSLKGDLQVQTNWTDGKHSIEEMAKEAKKQGLEYIAITDHTKDLAMTRGSDEQKLLRQMKEIDKLNKKLSGITILKGAEANIRRDGTLDISDDVLSELDVVGVSVHSLFHMTKKDMTERIVRAISNPHVDILFHPTGRLINKRNAYEVDMTRVMQEAKKTGTVLEINAFPDRLDLKDVHIREAKELGVKFTIDSDAHHINHFRMLKFGIAQARRGWAEKKDVLNTYPLSDFLSLLKNH